MKSRSERDLMYHQLHIYITFYSRFVIKQRHKPLNVDQYPVFDIVFASCALLYISVLYKIDRQDRKCIKCYVMCDSQ